MTSMTMPIRIHPVLLLLIIRMLIMKTLPNYSTLDKAILPTHILPPKSADAPAFTMVLDLDERTLWLTEGSPCSTKARSYTLK